MGTYVAFLRAVNVGGRNVKMAALRDHLTGLGYGDVETYIQTGNVRLRTSLRSAAKLRADLEKQLAALCGFDVTTMVYTPAELAAVFADATTLTPTLNGSEVRRYVSFLLDEPTAKASELVAALDFPGESVRVIGRAVHWELAHPSQQAKLSNARLEKLVGPATTRDLKVVTALAQMWGN
jgi:uncharacterized protein (DUF1697 family)